MGKKNPVSRFLWFLSELLVNIPNGLFLFEDKSDEVKMKKLSKS
jgi:hypothetical protein